jgi:threonine dehydrogenase-like Zn-dependent dehydrogenase
MKVLSVNLNRSKNSKNFSEVSDFKIPNPNKNEILFKTVACGVCATDIETLINKKQENMSKKAVHGKTGNKYLGHEVVGRAIKVGKNISQKLLGKNFVIADINICKAFGIKPICKNCKKSQGIHCLNKTKRVFSRYVFGGYSEYFIRSVYQSLKINSKVKPSYGCFAEPLSTAINISRLLRRDENILIHGLGVISTLLYRFLIYKKFNKKNICMLVENQNNLNQCKKLGIENATRNIKKKKFNKIVYFSGNLEENKKIIDNMFQKSSLIYFGDPSNQMYPFFKNISLSEIKTRHHAIIRKQISIKGIHGYSSEKVMSKKNFYLSDVEKAVDLIEKNSIILKDLISEKVSISDAKQKLDSICLNVIKKKKKQKNIFRTIFLENNY